MARIAAKIMTNGAHSGASMMPMRRYTTHGSGPCAGICAMICQLVGRQASWHNDSLWADKKREEELDPGRHGTSPLSAARTIATFAAPANAHRPTDDLGFIS